jgi:hypothetical protein
MKTVLYSDILYQACEATGRTRDKLPLQEAVMLQGFIATPLRDIWNGNYQWPELIPAIVSVTTVNRVFSKNEGSEETQEFGDILGVWANNPLETASYQALRFDEQDGQVQLEDGGGEVFVEFMLPCPDLMALAGDDLLNYELPARFRNFLAWMAAGHLASADGQVAQSDTFLGLAQMEIDIELRRLVEVPRRAVRMKNTYNAKQIQQRAAGA